MGHLKGEGRPRPPLRTTKQKKIYFLLSTRGCYIRTSGTPGRDCGTIAVRCMSAKSVEETTP